MSQYDFGNIDPAVNNGTQLAGFINGFRDAVNSVHSGSKRPEYARPGMAWMDTSTNNAWKLNVFDGANDILFATFNPSTHTLALSGLDTVYRKDTFKSDGTPFAPVIYSDTGSITARDFVVSNPAADTSLNISAKNGLGGYARYYNEGVQKWSVGKDNSDNFGLFNLVANAWTFYADKTTNVLNFPQTPTVGGCQIVVKDANGRLPALDGSQLTGIAGLGNGQVVTDVTGSRASNVVYQNTTGKPIFVAVTYMSANGSTGFYSLYIGSTNNPTTSISGMGSTNGSTQSFTICGIIPPGYYYKAGGSGPSMVLWTELR